VRYDPLGRSVSTRSADECDARQHVSRSLAAEPICDVGLPSARLNSLKRLSTRPRLPRYCRSSIRRRATSRRCSRRSWRRRTPFAAPRGLAIFDGEQFRFVPAHGVPDFVEYSVRPSRDRKAPLERLTRGEPLIHLADARAVDAKRPLSRTPAKLLSGKSAGVRCRRS
jgi:hypothetical protein